MFTASREMPISLLEGVEVVPEGPGFVENTRPHAAQRNVSQSS